MSWDSCDWCDDPEDIAKKYKSDHKIEEKVLKARSMKRKVKNDEMIGRMIRELSALCDEPKPGEQWRIVTEKQFNSFALVSHLVTRHVIDEMYLAIYRINEPTVDSLIEMIDKGKIKKATFIISSFFNQTKRPEQWAIKLKEYAEGKPNCRHCYTHNHSKVLAVKTTDGQYFVFEGSGNMSDNARIEQYIYENFKKMFEFHKEWMGQLADTLKNAN